MSSRRIENFWLYYKSHAEEQRHKADARYIPMKKRETQGVAKAL